MSVWLILYSNSFSYTDSTNRYYLFGDQDITTSPHYYHYLFVKDYYISSHNTSNNIYTYLTDTEAIDHNKLYRIFEINVGSGLSSKFSSSLTNSNAQINGYSSSSQMSAFGWVYLQLEQLALHQQEF